MERKMVSVQWRDWSGAPGIEELPNVEILKMIKNKN